jgi:hypothetical protein
VTRALAAALLLVAVPAAARPARVAVLDVAIEGDAEPELRTQLAKSVEGGLAGAGYDVVAYGEVAARLRGTPALVGCTSTACLGRIGALVGAKRFVRARVEAAGAAYTVVLELLGADVAGGVVQRLERSCPVCTLREVAAVTGYAVGELVGARPAPPRAVKVTIDSQPPGASVSCDGNLLGVAPVDVEVEPGTHVYRATLPGHRPEERAAIAAEAPVHLVLQLEPEVVPVAPEPAEGSRFGAWKWAAAGGAVAALAGGIVLVALDGRGTECDPGATCRSLYSTQGAGIGLLAVGAALGAGAAWMFVTDRVEAHVGPTALSLRVHF